MHDPIRLEREIRKEQGLHYSIWIAIAAIFAFSLWMFHREFAYVGTDFYVHSIIASEFDFSDLHSITSRLAYPLWHLCVAVIYQLGMPIEWAAALVSALCKMAAFYFTHRTINAICGDQVKQWHVTLISFLLMLVTAVRIFPINQFVYKGIGSPNVWHNPTQQAVTAVMMLCIPYLVHCGCEFERMRDAGNQQIMLPWRKVLWLAVLLMASLACKPTFMQALLPAAFVMFLAELIRNKKQWRYFMQIIIAFLPAVAYFLLQYLYYTGELVEYTSGVEIGITMESMTVAIRNTVMMSAFPLASIAVCYRKGMFKDRMLVIGLLMTAFSVIEAMAFRETGMRSGHGNFTWAANSSSFFMWVIMTGIFLRTLAQDIKQHQLTLVKKAGYGISLALLVWHLGSGIYYLYYLLSSNNAF